MGAPRALVKQVGIAWLMWGVAAAWHGAYAPARPTLDEPLLLARHAADAAFLAASGAALAALALLYLQLPVKLIPRWVPIVGALDSLLAAGAFLVGTLLMALGWWAGADRVRDAMRPTLGDWVEPDVQRVALEAALERADMFLGAVGRQARPLLEQAGEVLQPAAAQLAPHLRPIADAAQQLASRLAQELARAAGVA